LSLNSETGGCDGCTSFVRCSINPSWAANPFLRNKRLARPVRPAPLRLHYPVQ
jgi:hypothetical protein